MVTIIQKSSSNQNYESLPKPQEATWYQTLWGILKPLGYFDTIQKRHGDMFITPPFAGLPEQLIISNPEAIQQIFTANSNLFESGSASKVIQPLVGDTSVILLDGKRHLQQRKLLMPPFHGERMQNYGEQIYNIAEQVMSKVNTGEKFTARPLMQEISLTVILHTIFGLSEGEKYQQIKEILTEMLDVFNAPLSSIFLFFKGLQKDLGAWSPWGKFLRRRQKLDELLFEIIQERRTQGETTDKDILSLLLCARDEEGQPMTNSELRDELMTMLFAGHETTATALAWALYWIHAIPEVRDKLVAELESVDLKNRIDTDPMEIIKLPYLNAVCSETLRIYPVAFFTLARILQAPMQLIGYDLPKGMVLSPCIYLTHHNPEIYPEPKKFKPERFLERQFTPYEYLPFGGGNRRCLGMAFAQFEMKLVLATLLSRYSFNLVDKNPLLPVRRGITFAPKGGVKLRMEKVK
ncbi:MAG: cytochrome P450 [Cyanobacteria bacterium P01_A01_bin.84]